MIAYAKGDQIFTAFILCLLLSKNIIDNLT